MRHHRLLTGCLLILWVTSDESRAQSPQLLDGQMHHLRAAGPREWTEFPPDAEGPSREVRFSASSNDGEWALELRQYDVKQDWDVTLNGKPLGKLPQDENEMRIYYAVPPGSILSGENVLKVQQPTRGNPPVDDIRVGEIKLHPRSRESVLSTGNLEIRVNDGDSNQPLPSRLTIASRDGILQSVWPYGQSHLAVRPGVVYTATGQARLGLPPGEYTIYAGRGFEYSLASRELSIPADSGATATKVTLTIRREVPTEGFAACDTHVHTLTHSGHGDATVEERMITLAGEGIELPVAADHNVQIDHDPFARTSGVRRLFTPIIGNEVTTRVGHFIIFPVMAGGQVPDARLTEWQAIFDNIERVAAPRVIVLNHARDLHSNVRPFGPAWHNAVVGENLAGWELRAHGMEVVNSSATQTDPMQLLHDWMGQLNRGRILAPVASSDSHDVGRHFVGQGRTYIRCDDRDPGQISIPEAVDNFLGGHVLVSYGLLARLDVNDQHSSGDLAPSAEEYRLRLRVLAPHWITADHVELFANGERIMHWDIPATADVKRSPGIKWEGEYRLPRPRHDTFLTVIATGPGIQAPYWKTAKPYQPTSPDWSPRVVGCSGAVWLDADGDGRKSSAYDYARSAFDDAGGDLAKLVASLARFDRAVAAQAAHRYQSSGKSLLDAESRTIWMSAAPAVQAGFNSYLAAWRENQAARAKSP